MVYACGRLSQKRNASCKDCFNVMQEDSETMDICEVAADPYEIAARQACLSNDFGQVSDFLSALWLLSCNYCMSLERPSCLT